MIQKNNLEPSQTKVATLTQKGIALHQQGNLTEAQVMYEQILVIQPDHFDALQLLGVLFAQVKKYPQAVEFLSKALEINPNHAGANNNKGNALKELKRFDEALASYDQAIKINPDYVDAYINRGNLLRDLKQFDEALASYDQAIKINPNHAVAYSNRGNSLRDLKRFEEALASYDKAISLNPNHAGTFCNRGIVLQGLQRTDEALASYDRAIEIDPDLITAHYNLSLFNLMKGNFKAGWQGYEWRWLDKDFDSEPLKSAKPVWDFKKTNQCLLVWAEQGVGDQVSFGSLLSELLEDVPNLLVQIDKRLIPIFTRSLPKIKFYPDSLILPESDYDIHIPIGSLGKYLRNNEQDCEVSRYGFLKDNQANTSKIKKELMALTPSNNKICGISWRSRSTNTGAGQNIGLKYFIEMLNLEDHIFVSLQYGETKEEIQEVRDELGINIISYEKVDNYLDIDGLSSLIQACDTVISVGNVNCHLAGALGKEIHVLLTDGSWWGWLLERDDSPWYASVKLYRQEKIDDWDAPIKKLKNELKS